MVITTFKRSNGLNNIMEKTMINSSTITFKMVDSDELIEQTRKIFREYQESIETDLCFQKFEEELASLPGKYSLPQGRLYLTFIDDEIVGCVALRPMEDKNCEMKRLYVRPEYRGIGLGRILAEKIINDAKEIGYKKMFLDTLDTMTFAVKLYNKLGFQDSHEYCFNPIEGAIFMELIL